MIGIYIPVSKPYIPVNGKREAIEQDLSMQQSNELGLLSDRFCQDQRLTKPESSQWKLSQFTHTYKYEAIKMMTLAV